MERPPSSFPGPTAPTGDAVRTLPGRPTTPSRPRPGRPGRAGRSPGGGGGRGPPRRGPRRRREPGRAEHPPCENEPPGRVRQEDRAGKGERAPAAPATTVHLEELEP